MQTITKEKVKRVASLANIKLSEDELEKYTGQIAEILGYVEKLSEIKTDGAIFKSQTDLSNVFRKDEPKKSLSNLDATRNRKETSKNGYIVIKGVLNKE